MVEPDEAPFPAVGANETPASKSSGIPLNQLIQQHPVEMLGERVLEQFGPRLPYLMKVLAADRALSLQVHPAAHLARAGFNRENRDGVPLDDPHRSFATRIISRK